MIAKSLGMAELNMAFHNSSLATRGAQSFRHHPHAAVVYVLVTRRGT